MDGKVDVKRKPAGNSAPHPEKKTGGEPPVKVLAQPSGQETGENHAPYFDEDGRLRISKQDFNRWRDGVRKRGDKQSFMKVIYVTDLGNDRQLNLGCTEEDSRRPLMFNGDGCLIISEADYKQRWKNIDDGKPVLVKEFEPGADRQLNLGCEESEGNGPGDESDDELAQEPERGNG